MGELAAVALLILADKVRNSVEFHLLDLTLVLDGHGRVSFLLTGLAGGVEFVAREARLELARHVVGQADTLI